MWVGSAPVLVRVPMPVPVEGEGARGRGGGGTTSLLSKPSGLRQKLYGPVLNGIEI